MGDFEQVRGQVAGVAGSKYFKQHPDQCPWSQIVRSTNRSIIALYIPAPHSFGRLLRHPLPKPKHAGRSGMYSRALQGLRGGSRIRTSALAGLIHSCPYSTSSEGDCTQRRPYNILSLNFVSFWLARSILSLVMYKG